MDSQAPDNTVFAFGPFRLDKARRCLLRSGEQVRLTPRLFDTLVYLVQNHGRVVGKDEILQAVWGGRIVEEANLSQAIFALRKVFQGEGPLIATAPGRGYQFVGDVAVIAPDPPPPPGTAVETIPQAPYAARLRSRAGILACLAAAGAIGLLLWSWLDGGWSAPRLSIAVMPLRNHGPDRAQDYLADALGDDLRADLAHIPSSVVIARESVEALRDRNLTAPQIGRALQVRYLVGGAVSADAGTVHIEVVLSDAASGTQIASLRQDVQAPRMATAQTILVRQLAAALDIRLTEIESARSIHDRPNDPDAVDLFLRARAGLENDDTLAGLDRAQAMLEQAVREQPDFGDALSLLGAMLLHKVQDFGDPQERSDFAHARDMIARALAVAPRNAQALAARARVLAIEGRWTDAAASARAAIEIEPSDLPALQVLARCEQAQGNLDAEAATLDSLMRLQPEGVGNKQLLLSLGYARLQQGRTEQALGLLQRAIAGDADPQPGTDTLARIAWARLGEVAAIAMLGDLTLAQHRYAEAKLIWPRVTVWRFAEYFPPAVRRLPGFQRIRDSLQAAGMAPAASEPEPAAPPGAASTGDDFAPTPAALPAPGVTLTTDQFKALRQAGPPLILDLGHGVAVPQGGLWFSPRDPSASATDFVDRMLLAHPGAGQDVPVILMGDGPTGCAAYDAALHLLAKGTRRVAWYRGGEEAWDRSGGPSDPERRE